MKKRRGRKPKQTMLNQYFTVQNTKSSETCETANIEALTTGSTKDDKTKILIDSDNTNNDNNNVNVHCNNSLTKSSRYGRIIKPKSYEIQYQTKMRKDQINHVPQTTNESSMSRKLSADDSTENQNSENVIVPLVKKRGRPKKSNVEVLVQTETEPAIEPSQPPEVTFDNSIEPVEMDVVERIFAKRRGRPSKNQSMNTIIDNSTAEASASQIVDQPVHEIENNDEQAKTTDTVNIIKRRGRPPKSVNASTTEIITTNTEPDSSQESEPNTIPQKRVAKTKNYIQTIDQNTNTFTCGNCKELIPDKKWKAHIAKHYGVTWREDVDEAIDINDPLVMNREMIKFMKATKLQYFKCAKCSIKKKSALGYISHIEICGLTPEEILTMKTECPYCKKLYRKVSLEAHIQGFCPVRRLAQAAEKADADLQAVCDTPEENLPNEEVVYTESGRPKRIIKKVVETKRTVDDFIKIGMKITGGVFKGWQQQLRDENIIKCSNTSCTYSTIDINEMRSHYKECKSNIHRCKLCLLPFYSRQEIIEHIETKHQDDMKVSSDEESNSGDDDDFNTDQSTSSDDDSSGESDSTYEEIVDNKTPRKAKKPYKRKTTVPVTRVLRDDCPDYWEMVKIFYARIKNSRPGYFRMVYTWTKEFIENNYYQHALTLNDFICDNVKYTRLTQAEANKCVKMLEQKSMEFFHRKQKDYSQMPEQLSETIPSNRLNILEGMNLMEHENHETSVLFCGGRIVTLDWIPFPTEYTGDEILIVSTQDKDSSLTSATNHLPFTNSYTTLIQLWSISATKSDNEIKKPNFLYGIAYYDGPIYSISICPSDAYIPSKRLAIIAIPDSNGNINILSLPDQISTPKNHATNIIKLKSEIKLQLGFENAEEELSQAVTQLSWSRTKGHKVICAGYNTGTIAIWNFEHLKSSYLCRKASNNTKILLPYKIFQGSMSSITQLDIHSDNEDKVRWILVGGLDRKIRMYDLNDAQLIPFMSPTFKSRISSGIWPLHWPVYLTIVDAALTRINGGIHIKQILYTNTQPQSSNLTFNCFASNISFSDWYNTAIFGTDAGDIFMVNFQQMLAHDRSDESSELKVLSSTDVISNDDSSESASDKCINIVFNDFDDNVLAPKLQTRISSPEQHLFTKINRIAFNPNEANNNMYAIGYELGFCRIRFIRKP